MPTSRVRRRVVVLVCTVSAFISSLPRADTPPETGDLWQVVTQMSMEGMPMKMPARRIQVCAARDWTRPPGGDDADRGCTSSDVVVEDQTMTWTSTCSDGMTGHGEITRDGDNAYAGTIVYASEDGDVTINIEGKKIGECDHPQ